MSEPSIDRELLFGILALQNNFITRDALVSAFSIWVADKKRPFDQILGEQGKLSADLQALLHELVKQHLTIHDNDPQKSLAAIKTIQFASSDLEQLDGASIDRLIQSLLGGSSSQPHETTMDYNQDPSQSVSRFRVLRPLAKGGLGEVFIAQDLELHREVALKEIQKRFTQSNESRSRFVLEAEITGRLEHPGIVPVYGLGQYADGRLFYAMRFIRGESMARAIHSYHHPKEGSTVEPSFVLRQLLGRLIDVCQAVEYAHSRGIIHRDLKPDNIMLGKHGETLVVDWGLAKSLGHRESTSSDEATLHPVSSGSVDKTMQGSAIGTPAYMSPEQAEGKHEEVTAASDIYSIGATLYCLLTGQPPFQGKDMGETLQRVKAGDFPPPRSIRPSISKGLEAICLKAMALRPEDRYASAIQLANDLELWLADEPIAVYRDSVTTQLARWTRKHKGLFASTVAFGLIGLIGISIFAYVLNEKNHQLTISEGRAIEGERLAKENAKTAREATFYATQTAETVLSAMPKQETTREQLFASCLKLYEKLASDNPNDLSIQQEMVKVTRMVGNFKRLVRKLSESETLLARSIELQKKIGSQELKDILYLAETYRDIATLYKTSGDLKKAENWLDQSSAIVFNLTQEIQSDPMSQRSLAATDLERVGLFEDLERTDEAVEAARKSWETSLHLIDSEAKVDNDQLVALFAASRLGQQLHKQGHREEAFKIYDLALERGKSWIEDENPNKRRAYARLFLYKATDLSVASTPEPQAMAHVDEALQRYQALQKINNTAAGAESIASSYRTKGVLLSKIGKSDEAVQAFNMSVDQLNNLSAEQRAADAHQSLASTHFEWAQHFLRNDKPVDARNHLEQAVGLQKKAIQMKPIGIASKNKLARYEQALMELK